MDEYERAASDLRLLIEQIPDDDFTLILDTQTKDEDCRSVQTIISHVIGAGYHYADYIRKPFGISATSPSRRLLSRQEAKVQLEAMLDYTAQTLEGRWEMSDAEMAEILIDSSWGVRYDLEQMLEHAIVHILRHRRQMERLLAAEAANKDSNEGE